MKLLCAFFTLSCICSGLFAQVMLDADGQTDTYSLINSVLAPGYDVVEVPDCDHVEFGPHIDQVFDNTLDQYVFRFHIHKDEDSDRCKNYDRQRVEIKTYDKSPDNLKAIEGEKVEYKWKFKLASDFAASSSFTHLHQLKAVGGSEESMPLITLTARKGTPDKLELRYAEFTSQTTITKVDLEDFKGQWVEVIEEVVFGEDGSYKILIKAFPDAEVLFDYSNDDIRMWKTDADFLRPKWGIYRSLNNAVDLKDEQVLFANFSIHELDNTSIGKTRVKPDFNIMPNPNKGSFELSNVRGQDVYVYNQTGVLVQSVVNSDKDRLALSGFEKGMYFVTLVSEDASYQTGKMCVY